jgi:hypothetical protein
MLLADDFVRVKNKSSEARHIFLLCWLLHL